MVAMAAKESKTNYGNPCKLHAFNLAQAFTPGFPAPRTRCRRPNPGASRVVQVASCVVDSSRLESAVVVRFAVRSVFFRSSRPR